MLTDVTSDLFVWGVAFAFGSIFSWLVWLTVRHYSYGKPAYDALTGGEMSDGHLSETKSRFDHIEESQDQLRERVDDVERKVDDVDNKTDRNYRLLSKIAEAADIDGFFLRGSDNDEPGPDRTRPGDD